MTTIMPEGDDLRKAIKWISEEHQDKPDRSYRRIIEDACLKFNLSPKGAEYLLKLVKKDKG